MNGWVRVGFEEFWIGVRGRMEAESLAYLDPRVHAFFKLEKNYAALEYWPGLNAAFIVALVGCGGAAFALLSWLRREGVDRWSAVMQSQGRLARLAEKRCGATMHPLKKRPGYVWCVVET